MDKETSEIGKLTERISKDPKSKLFVPLAEAYKKLGDIEMAIHVLTEGLKKNPGYITAKSFLGRLLLEKGDLAGAQKELEEVVKAIPDNLLAQRKLGDLYALQGKTQAALVHYKAALSINSKDEEIASLVADLGAGRDVSGKLAKLLSRSAPEQGAAQGPSARAGAATARKAPDRAAGKSRVEEEPEEVLVVEPLDAETSAPPAAERATAGSGFDFLAETAPVSGEAEERREDAFAFALNEQQGRLEPSAAGVPPAAEAAPSTFSRGPEESPKTAKQADDFTTDTLAELYLAQGFYEKAIDIYERMLADNPENQGLKNKLQQVRAAAGQALSPASGAETSAPVEEELSMETGPLPALDEPFGEMSPASAEAPGTAGDVPPVLEQPPETRFEPAEFVPGGSGFQGSGMKTGSEIRPVPADRKETIDRLEKWLKNIMKER